MTTKEILTEINTVRLMIAALNNKKLDAIDNKLLDLQERLMEPKHP